MNTPDQTKTAKTAPRPRKNRGWLWVLLALGLLSLCAIVVGAVFSLYNYLSSQTDGFSQDPLYVTEVNITAGTYQDNRYTPSEQNFSCDFGEMLNGTVYPSLYDRRQEDYGAVWSMDGYGQQFGVDYFRYSVLPDETKDLLEDPQTMRDGLQKLFEDILLSNRQQNYSGIEVVHQGFVNDEILFVVLDVPHGSNLSQNNVALDSQEADYIFVKGEWFYFVFHIHTPTETVKRFDKDKIQTRVEEFYRGCNFKP